MNAFFFHNFCVRVFCLFISFIQMDSGNFLSLVFRIIIINFCLQEYRTIKCWRCGIFFDSFKHLISFQCEYFFAKILSFTQFFDSPAGCFDIVLFFPIQFPQFQILYIELPCFPYILMRKKNRIFWKDEFKIFLENQFLFHTSLARAIVYNFTWFF